MTAYLNKDDMTCNAAALGELFDCTSRNVLHYVDKGMPVLKRGKAGREHEFNASWSVNWYFGMKACEKLGRRLPRTLETTLTGFFCKGREMAGETFNVYQRRARKIAEEMGYSRQQYDAAIDHLLAERLIRW